MSLQTAVMDVLLDKENSPDRPKIRNSFKAASPPELQSSSNKYLVLLQSRILDLEFMNRSLQERNQVLLSREKDKKVEEFYQRAVMLAQESIQNKRLSDFLQQQNKALRSEFAIQKECYQEEQTKLRLQLQRTKQSLKSHKTLIQKLQKQVDEFVKRQEKLRQEQFQTEQRIRDESAQEHLKKQDILLQRVEELTQILKAKIEQLQKSSSQRTKLQVQVEQLKRVLQESTDRLQATQNLYQQQLESANRFIQELKVKRKAPKLVFIFGGQLVQNIQPLKQIIQQNKIYDSVHDSQRLRYDSKFQYKDRGLQRYRRNKYDYLSNKVQQTPRIQSTTRERRAAGWPVR